MCQGIRALSGYDSGVSRDKDHIRVICQWCVSRDKGPFRVICQKYVSRDKDPFRVIYQMCAKRQGPCQGDMLALCETYHR